VPTDLKPRVLSTAINENDNTASLALAMDGAGYFELDAGQAREIAAQVGKVVSTWRDQAARPHEIGNRPQGRQLLRTRICVWQARSQETSHRKIPERTFKRLGEILSAFLASLERRYPLAGLAATWCWFAC
jgi:hypothetical protein